jgi:hypothetical protein
MKQITLPRANKKNNKAQGPRSKRASARVDRSDSKIKSAPGSAQGARPSLKSSVSATPVHPELYNARETSAAAPASPAPLVIRPELEPMPIALARKSGFGIDIQLDPRITAGEMRDRCDSVINGVVVASQPIEAVSLVQNGEVKSLTLYPRNARSPQAFCLSLAQRKGLDLDASSFEVVARTNNGEESRASFTIATSRDDSRVAHIVQGQTCELSLETTNSIPIMLYVEIAAIDRENVLHVRGWSVARTQIVAIQVSIGEQRAGFAQFGQSRGDIATVYPGYPNAHMSGFSLAQALP